MNQARKDTTGIKLEVNERFVLYFFFTGMLVIHQVLSKYFNLLQSSSSSHT